MSLLQQQSVRNNLNRERTQRMQGVTSIPASQMIRQPSSDNLPDYPRAWFYPMLPWGAPVTSFPHKRLRNQDAILLWEVFTVAWVIYIAVDVPYRGGFGMKEEFPVCQWDWKISIDVLSDFVFLVDMLVQMHCAFFVLETDGQWTLVDKLPEIRESYFARLMPWERSALWDFLAAFPFRQIGCAIWNNHASGELDTSQGKEAFNWAVAIMLLAMLRVTKLLRLWKIIETIEHVDRNRPGLANIFQVFKLISILFFVAHYLGCIWFQISPKEDDADEGWIYLEGGILPRDRDNWLYEWITSMYWSVTTMTTIGYGDISAHTMNERIFAMFGMAIGSTYFAWLAGTITGILSKGSAGTERFLGFLEEVRQYMDIKHFSEGVKKMVFVFYGLKFPTQLIFNDSDIMESLPKGLKKRMQAETYMDMIEVIPLFSDCTLATRIEICNAFETYYCAKEEEVTTEDEEPDALFIVRFGDVLLTRKGDRLAIARRGTMFGELAILGLTENGLRLRTAVSLSECELLRLPRNKIKELMVTHADLRTSFRKLASRHLRLVEKEGTDVDSPIHDPDKMVHIFANWQLGRVPDLLRLGGKVRGPIIPKVSDDQKEKMVTWIRMTTSQLKGFPVFSEPGVVTLRLQVEWETPEKDTTLKQEFTYQQGLPVNVDWRVVLKYRHTSDKEEGIQNLKKNVTIKVIFVKLVTAADAPPSGVSADLGFAGGGGGGGGVGGMNATQTVPKPFKETTVGEFSVPVQKFFDWSLRGEQAIDGRWQIGSYNGDLKLTTEMVCGRELPSNSITRATFRSIMNRKRRERDRESAKLAREEEAAMKKATRRNRRGSRNLSDILPISGEAGQVPGDYRKWLEELKGGVASMLAKGDPGKSGASATSFERMQEKQTDELLQRMRDMKDQIAAVEKFVKGFEVKVGEDFVLSMQTVETRLKLVLEEQANMKQHLVDVQSRREQHASEIKAALANSDAQSRARELMVIDMLQQIAKKQGLMLSMVPPQSVAMPTLRSQGSLSPLPSQPAPAAAFTTQGGALAAPPRASLATAAAPAPPSLAGGRVGVGLRLGGLREETVEGYGRVHLAVNAVIAGGSADQAGVRGGDDVVAVDGEPVAGRSAEEARAMLQGAEGSRAEVLFWRPETGEEFRLVLERRL